MRHLALFLFALRALGQTPAPLAFAGPTAPMSAGQVANFTLTLTGNAPAGAEFALLVPLDATNLVITPGAAATAAGKTAQCGPIQLGQAICLVIGVPIPPATTPAINATAIANGVIANIAMTLGPTTPQIFTIVTPGIEATPGGLEVTPAPVVAPNVVSITILSPCDVTGDGKTDLTDAQAIVGWALRLTAVPAGAHCDLNGDGKCDAADVQIVVNAANGQPCIGH